MTPADALDLHAARRAELLDELVRLAERVESDADAAELAQDLRRVVWQIAELGYADREHRLALARVLDRFAIWRGVDPAWRPVVETLDGYAFRLALLAVSGLRRRRRRGRA